MNIHQNYQAPLRSIAWLLAVLAAIQFASWLIPPINQIKGIAGYAPLHSLLEIVAIVISVMVFGICWNAPTQGRAGNFFILACVFLGVASLDFMHALSYQDMPDFVTPSSSNKAIYFWLSARLLSVLGFLAVAILPWRPSHIELRRWLWLCAVTALIALIGWIGLFHLEWMPATFVSGEGLTPFKIVFEYVLIILLIIIAARFLFLMRMPQNFDVTGLFAAVGVMALSEFYFTLYSDVTDVFNLLGHVYKVLAYWFVYRSIFSGSIKEPYQRLSASEKSLKKSEERFALAMKGANDGLWDWNLDTDEVYYSPHWKEMLGYREDELENRLDTWERLVHPDDRERALKQVEEYISGRANSFSVELRMQHKDGRWLHILSRAFLARRESDGRAERLIGTHVDMTGRKQDEESMQLADLVYQNSSEGMMVTDESNLIVAINPAFTRITGYSFDEVKGRNPRELSSGRHDSSFYQAMWHEIRSNGYWQGEIWDKRKDGTLQAKQLTINTIRNEDGSVHRYVALFSDITSKKQSDELIWKQANFDSLTGLPNRNMFGDRLQQEIIQCTRSHTSLALFLIDLDQFKEVNDTLGHGVGDTLLQEAAQRIRASMREADTVARLGGDEFTVILPELQDIVHLDNIAQKLINDLAAPYRLGNEIVHVSASIGISLYPEDASEIIVLMKNADQAMYAAKHQGRNRYSYFTQSMQEAAQVRLHLSNDLRLALEREEFVLHYQPQIDIETGRVTGVEALVRWQHPEKGLVPPGVFIPIIEETDLILLVGEWVMRTACHQLKLWLDHGMTDMQMSVNLSARQLRQKTLVSTVTTLLQETAITPASLELEITESLAMDNPEENTKTVALLRSIGVGVAIDDFGTGHSSLGYLKDFPITRLKLDRSFIINIESEPNDTIIVAAAIDLAHDLGLDVVAEGVETGKQVEYLTRLNCDTIQGYHFSKPLPADAAEAYIRKRNAAPRLLAERAGPVVDVLVIDDDEVICRILANVFSSMGHRPSTVTDPVQGVEMLRRDPDRYAMIMIDMLMPNMSGIDLMQSLRAIRRDVPVVVVTSYKTEAVRAAFKPMEKQCNLLPGINYFVLEKPVDKASITRLTQKLIHAPV